MGCRKAPPEPGVRSVPRKGKRAEKCGCAGEEQILEFRIPAAVEDEGGPADEKNGEDEGHVNGRTDAAGKGETGECSGVELARARLRDETKAKERSDEAGHVMRFPKHGVEKAIDLIVPPFDGGRQIGDEAEFKEDEEGQRGENVEACDQ